MFIWWGPGLIQFYNDAYRQTMGPERHPSALVARGRDCWDEIWPIIGPQIDLVMRGDGSTWHEEQLVPVTRHGRLQEVRRPTAIADRRRRPCRRRAVVCDHVTEHHLAKKTLARTERAASRRRQSPCAISSAPPLPGSSPSCADRDTSSNSPIRPKTVSSDHLQRPVGRASSRLCPNWETQGFIALLDQVDTSGQAHVGTSARVALQGGSNGPARTPARFRGANLSATRRAQ